ncbi:hypothetical protein PG993_012390 [Apiospora rasikravindrae]|uniref:Beta-glucuronidase C-terminal domain-containing protein n=1 Tax=Apiospora rasikravindrae TaxID=990691 RepID=A0ABR1S2C2_9PEZI
MTKPRSLIVALAAASFVTGQETTSIKLPSGDVETRPLVRDVFGYSIEPIWVNAYTDTPKAFNLLSAIGAITGKPPPIRVGGNTADQTYQHATLPNGRDWDAVRGELSTVQQFNVTPAWYGAWADYFPPGTDLIYSLNFRANESGWANAVAQAEAVHAALGDKLKMFELGNEIDHFINKGWRGADWGVERYIDQFRNLTGQIVAADWYQKMPEPQRPKFQAGVFADPPWVPDQHDEIDDFSIENLTTLASDRSRVGGIVEQEQDKAIIGSYAMHLYPQSTCDTERWHRMRLDLLSDHLVLWQNVSQYAPQVAAADRAGAPLIMGETNSVSCSGRSGISDTFGAALWTVDYVLLGAALGLEKTYFHLGAQSEYSAFTPAGYELKNESLAGGIRPNWYSHYFVAKVVAAPKDSKMNYSIAALGGEANSSSLSGYAVYSGAVEKTEPRLYKLAFLDMGVWNGTEGLTNPSTLSATDGTMFSEGARPNRTLNIATSWCAGRNATVTRLLGPGTNAKNDVTVSGVSFDPESGDMLGMETKESVEVGGNGAVAITMRRAEAVLLEIEDVTPCGAPLPPTSAAVSINLYAHGVLSLVVYVVGLTLLL